MLIIERRKVKKNTYRLVFETLQDARSILYKLEMSIPKIHKAGKVELWRVVAGLTIMQRREDLVDALEVNLEGQSQQW